MEVLRSERRRSRGEGLLPAGFCAEETGWKHLVKRLVVWADVAELADALDSKSGTREGVGVRAPPSAPGLWAEAGHGCPPAVRTGSGREDADWGAVDWCG